MSDSDPSYSIFGTEEPDLYGTLDLKPDAQDSEIRSAYRKLALKFHPDKLLTQDLNDKEKGEALKKFEKIGYAYKVLSDQNRRKRFDETGRTDENFLDESDQATWTEYFKDLWSGEVSSKTIEEFAKNYQGSEEELNDLHQHYLDFDGSLEEILSHTMCATEADEPRIIKRIDESIKSGLLPKKKRWESDKKDEKAKQKRHRQAQKESKEAEELAKELGVHDTLFGNGDDEGEEGEEEEGGGSTKKKSKKGKKSKEKDSEDSLRALIQSRSAGRHESLIAKLEAKALAESNRESSSSSSKSKSRGKKRKDSTTSDVEDVQAEAGGPTEEEFLKLQAEMDARRKKSSENKKQSESKKPKGGKRIKT